jgi:hypothetical protein
VSAELLTLGQLNRATLARQLLLGRADLPVVEAVERLAGMQAQEPKPPFVGLWTRLRGFARADLVEALHGRQVVRATMMRGTLHLVSARDYAALRATLQPMLSASMKLLGDRAAGLALDAVLTAARRLIAERPRTFEETRAALRALFPDVNDRALGFATRMSLPLVMVPTADRWSFPSNAAFALAEEWLGGPLDDAGAPERLVVGYLGAFGPASTADAQEWSGLGGLKPVFEALRPRLVAFRDESGRRELFDLPGAPRPDAAVPAPPRLLPEFDNLVLAHAVRTRVLADEHRGRVVTKNLRVNATFLVDGRVAGIWRIERKRATATLSIAPFDPLPPAAATALCEEGEALLRFVEGDASAFDVRVEAEG